MLARLAHFTYRRRRSVVAAWVVLFIGTFAVAGALGSEFRTEFRLPGSESQAAADLLARSGFGDRAGDSGRIVFETAAGVDDPAVRAQVEVLLAEVDGAARGTSVSSPYAPGNEHQIADGGTVFYADINFAERSNEAYLVAGEQIAAVVDGARTDGLGVSLGGDMFFDEEDGSSSEMIGVLAAMVILLLAFGSVLAMGLPIATALFGIGVGAAIVMIARTFIDMPDFTMAAISMVGIGVGIDYALFIVTRYREGLHVGLDPERAVVQAIDTAGRAVLFAGTTVMISVLGLLLTTLSSTQGVAIAISLGVLMTMLAAVTLLPALLGFVGTNIDRLGLPHRRTAARPGRTTFWYGWSRTLQRRPGRAAAAGFVVLLVLAAPTLSMRLGIGDAGNLPETNTNRQAYDTLARGFGPGFNGPLVLAVETPSGAADAPVLAALETELARTPGVAAATPPIANADGTAAVLQVFPTTSPQDEATSDLVTRLRDDVIPAATAGTDVTALVGGTVAALDDITAATAADLPLFIGAVLVLSFLLLMLVFRSILVPLKAVVMNLLSIGAAYGIVVAVYQWGWAADVFGVAKAGPIEAWAPVFLFAVVFGLSMDYEVFLLSRIREEYDRTGDNATAVADGVASTARVITAAAAIMVCVFGSFVLGPERGLALFGLGLAVAVFLDATVVRLLLVPATMELLGDANWWMPRWLDRILPRVHVEGGHEEREHEECDRVPAPAAPRIPAIPAFSVPSPRHEEVS
ncbi:MAG: MMPL family transporter, partial [Acidimicrobiia bacterium]